MIYFVRHNIGVTITIVAVFVFIVGFWLGVYSQQPFPVWIKTFEHWQTMTTGLLALLAAFIVAFISRFTVKEQVAREQRQNAMEGLKFCIAFTKPFAFQIFEEGKSAVASGYTDVAGNAKKADAKKVEILEDAGFPDLAQAIGRVETIYSILEFVNREQKPFDISQLEKVSDYCFFVWEWARKVRLGMAFGDLPQPKKYSQIIVWDIVIAHDRWLHKRDMDKLKKQLSEMPTKPK